MIDSELGFILLEADEKSIYDVLAEKTTWKDRTGMYGNGYHITYHLFPVFYKGYNMNIKSKNGSITISGTDVKVGNDLDLNAKNGII